MKTFTLPDLGEGLQDAEIVSWHVSVGDRVVADRPLVAVETEKAVVEVPAPWSGTVAKLHAMPGDVVKIGAPLADFDIGAETPDAGAVVGTLPAAAAANAGPAAGTRGKAVPAVRKLATDMGVDLVAIAGTGPGGAITRADVEAAAGTEAPGPWEPLRGVRRTMARNMARAHAEVAATTVIDQADVTHWPKNVDVTARLVRAVVGACRAEPALNAWYDDARQARLLHSKVDLGLAMETENGLFVPVLRDAGNREEMDLRAGLEAMKKDVAARSVPPEELQGQTLTLSNFGMLGGRHAALIVMPPQVAIIGAGRITDEPGVVDGEVRPCRVLPLSVTFDHRALTGAEATRFLMTMVADLEG